MSGMSAANPAGTPISIIRGKASNAVICQIDGSRAWL
jgi:hypothetical protein